MPPSRRRNMKAVKGKDTAPELTVRRLLYALGYRHRLHVRGLPGRPDIVLAGRRAVIEIRGCFWHRHPDPNCRNAVLPATRREWWAQKLDANVARDARNQKVLEAMGWKVLVIWECETRDVAMLTLQLTQFLGPSKAAQEENESRSAQAPLGHTLLHD
ncbi:very short patch repair endonuclease [Caulobacter endophyticus]|uniref:very short patch repair endonuclease n=1 Tax=Caulobacter endophyticus TaxID=2172652 RepID=UPI0022B93EB7|nr:very short patch repair endonuclease [Caulobacter endophyticus]